MKMLSSIDEDLPLQLPLLQVPHNLRCLVDLLLLLQLGGGDSRLGGHHLVLVEVRSGRGRPVAVSAKVFSTPAEQSFLVLARGDTSSEVFSQRCDEIFLALEAAEESRSSSPVEDEAERLSWVHLPSPTRADKRLLVAHRNRVDLFNLVRHLYNNFVRGRGTPKDPPSLPHLERILGRALSDDPIEWWRLRAMGNHLCSNFVRGKGAPKNPPSLPELEAMTSESPYGDREAASPDGTSSPFCSPSFPGSHCVAQQNGEGHKTDSIFEPRRPLYGGT
jgi:hypothetical protein